MLIADTNQFHPLVDGAAYAAGRAPDGSPYQIVIVRASEGTGFVDSAYASSLAEARAHGVYVGHYHFLDAGTDAAAQGTFFAQVVKGHGGLRAGDTIWCDCEVGTGDQTARVEAFLAAAHAGLGDNPADEGVYSGAAFWAAHLGTTPAAVHRWIAAYGAGSAPADQEMLWQFTDNQSVPGVSGPCDCSIYNGTLAQFLAAVGAGGVPPTAVTHAVAAAATVSGKGYWIVDAGGRVYCHGDAVNHGQVTGTLAAPVVGVAADSATGGYWLAGADGGVFAFGAGYHGSAAGVKLAAAVCAVAATADGGGYWLAARDGGVFPYGDAGFHGSMGGKTLAAPVVGVAATPTGRGYWLVGADGGIFAFGDAGMHGSMGGKTLAAPVVGVAATPTGAGYWLFGADGGVFCFGDAAMYGSMGGKTLAAPVVAGMRSATGKGYAEVGADGGVFAFGDFVFSGAGV